ncbi:MAG: hypothetical protein AB1298_00700 [Bacteroidota bacterium]
MLTQEQWESMPSAKIQLRKDLPRLALALIRPFGSVFKKILVMCEFGIAIPLEGVHTKVHTFSGKISVTVQTSRNKKARPDRSGRAFLELAGGLEPSTC